MLRLLLRQKTGEFFGEHGFFRFGVAHGDILNEVGKTAERLKNAFSQPSLLYSVRQSVYVALRAQKYGVVVAGKKFFVSLVLRQALVKQVVPPALSYVERKRHAGLIEAAVAAGYGSEADRLFPHLFFKSHAEYIFRKIFVFKTRKIFAHSRQRVSSLHIRQGVNLAVELTAPQIISAHAGDVSAVRRQIRQQLKARSCGKTRQIESLSVVQLFLRLLRSQDGDVDKAALVLFFKSRAAFF